MHTQHERIASHRPRALVAMEQPTAAVTKPKAGNKTTHSPQQEASSPETTGGTKPIIAALPPAPAPKPKPLAAPAAPQPTGAMAAAAAAATSTISSLFSWTRWAPYLNLPVTTSFAAEAKKAAFSVDNMAGSVEAGVLRELVKASDGMAFLTIAKGGIVVTGQFGSGLVVLKDPKTGKWSAPAAIATVGGGVGPQGGWDVTDVVLFFKTDSAAEAWKGSYQLAAGVSAGAALGPFGRQGNFQYHLRLGSKQLALAYALSWSKGFFLGAALDVKLLKALEGRNEEVYGPAASLDDILGGKVAPPAEAKPLLAALDRFVGGH